MSIQESPQFLPSLTIIKSDSLNQGAQVTSVLGEGLPSDPVIEDEFDTPHSSDHEVSDGNFEDAPQKEDSSNDGEPIEIVGIAAREATKYLSYEEEHEQSTDRISGDLKHLKRRGRVRPLSLYQRESDDSIPVNPSEHAEKRMAQRNLSEQDIAYVLLHGTRIRRTGVMFVTLLKKDIPKKDRASDKITRLEGVTILITPDGTISTSYRNKEALRDIRKKSKTQLYKEE